MNDVASPLTIQSEAAADWLMPFAVWFLVLANIFDMGGLFGIKYLSYLTGSAVLALRWRTCRLPAPRLALLIGLFLLWPLIAVAHGLSKGATIGDAVDEVTPFLPGILTYLLIRGTPAVRPLEILMSGLAMLALATTAIFLLLLLAPNSSVAGTVLAILQDEGHGYFGVRSLGVVTVPNVYFKATLFMVPAFGWFLFRRQAFLAFLCLAGLALTFSRAGVALAVIVAGAYLMVGSMRQKLAAIGVSIAIVVLIASNAELLQIADYLARLQDALLGRDESTLTRLGHLGSLLQMLNADPVLLWFGQGAGTAFYSTGAGAWVTDIELDHLDAIRQLGLAWFLAFSAIVLNVTYRAMRCGRDARAAAVALLAAFVASGTNPVLINPLFMIMLAMVAHLVDANDGREGPVTR